MSPTTRSDARAVFRFAPSPNGELHLGHAFSALLNDRLATRLDGRLLLRIEDIDKARCTPALEARLIRDLDWLGVSWEQPVRRQSEHFGEYQAALRRLIDEGLVYPAFMSRGEVRTVITEAERRGASWPRDPDGVPLYPGDDRALTAAERRRRMESGAAFTWRLDMAAAMAGAGEILDWAEFVNDSLSSSRRVVARPQDWGDVILARRDVPTSYHLAVVVDDALQGVTHVVRGADLFHATAVHRLLQTLLGLAAPAYRHHRLITDAGGRKLSKSAGDAGLRSLRESGVTPEQVRSMLGLK